MGYLGDVVPKTKGNIYYGWWIAGGAVLSQFAFLSVSHVSVGVLLGPVTQDLNWPAWAFTLGSSIAVGTGMLSGIVAGKVVDRKGPRGPMLLGALVTGVGLYTLSLQSSLWVFWACYAICGLVGWNLFGPLVVNSVLNKWFVAKRGWALAIGSTGISLAGMVTPVVLTAWGDTAGWRAGYTALAAFVLVVVVPVAVIARRTPEDHGLRPDGRDPSGHEEGDPPPEEVAFTRSEAVRTRSFWLLVTGFGLNSVALTSILVHAIPFATDAGFSRATASFAVSMVGVGNLSSKAIWASALQRIHPRWLAMTAFSTSAVGAFCVVGATSESILMVGFFLYGFGFGGTIPLTGSLWASYFGRAHIGAIQGISQPASSLGSSVAPVLVGLSFDRLGSYEPAFNILAGVYLLAALMIGLSRAPGPKDC